MTNREAHEEAAGMGLALEFFEMNGIDPDAEHEPFEQEPAVNAMEFEPVDSTNVEGTHHDGGQIMHVRFVSGEVYRYDGVTVEGHRKLRAAKSVGRHLRLMDVKGVKL